MVSDHSNHRSQVPKSELRQIGIRIGGFGIRIEWELNLSVEVQWLAIIRIPTYAKPNKLQPINAKPMVRTLGVQEAEDYIIDLLKTKGTLKTAEIYQISQKKGVRCPDDTVRFLNKMRIEGKINGEVSVEAKGWIWSLKA